MITDKTVFILGAGASTPYHFPTAIELRYDIIYKFSKQFISAHAEYSGKAESELDLPMDYKRLIKTFKDSSTKSIDLFLSRNNDYREVGKKTIAFLIGKYEMNSQFREGIAKPALDWYMHLYDILTKEISKPDDLIPFFENNKVSFITFNYDRSLEQFLYESFFNSFTTKREEIKRLFSKIKIIHVYGKLAPLPFETTYFHINYGSPNFYKDLEYLARNIKIVFEERKDDLSEAKQLISEAQKIFFLGFGYADENLNALDFNRLIHQGSRIYGTGLGLTESERRKIVLRLRGKKVEIVPERFTIDDCDSVMLLRKYL